MVSLLTSVELQADDASAAMARALQDPLASIKMLATDNTIGFNAGDDEGETNYNFQIQPVYSIPRNAEAKTNLIARAVVPIIGLEPGVVQPPIVPEPVPDSGSHWGLGDTTLQLFVSPKSEGNWKWGVGPQVSLATHTSDRTAGPGWGLGVAGVLVGSFTEQISFAAIALHHVGEDDFETTAVQPMLYYNFKSVPGMALSYNNMISYNWQADSGNQWNVPLGLTLSRTWALSGGGLDLGLGYYKLIEHPEGAPDAQIKFAISWVFN
ncbi:MAG: hypothetical protein V7744_21120 [Pseudomonadales bacterium]